MLFNMFLWLCHEEVFYFVNRAFHWYYLFCLQRQKRFETVFIFGMSSFSSFWNVMFTDRSLMSDITSRNFFSNASICLHCGRELFDLNLKSSLRISLLCFSCEKKLAVQPIRFPTLSIFLISLISYDSLHEIGMFFNE